MAIKLRPSDLQYKYQKNVAQRGEPKFLASPDPAPFKRDDLYEVIPMLEAVMNEMKSTDGRLLHLVEEIMNRDLPTFLVRRDEVFDFLVNCAEEVLAAARNR